MLRKRTAVSLRRAAFLAEPGLGDDLTGGESMLSE